MSTSEGMASKKAKIVDNESVDGDSSYGVDFYVRVAHVRVDFLILYLALLLYDVGCTVFFFFFFFFFYLIFTFQLNS